MLDTAYGFAEQSAQPLDPTAADQVFDGIYGSLAKVAQAKTQRTEFDGGQPIKIDIDPAAEFVSEHFAAAERRITAFDAQQEQATQVYDTFTGEVSAQARQHYAGKPMSVAARTERADRLIHGFIDRADTMVMAGETDALTLKTFFGSIDGFKRSLSTGYNSLVHKTDEPTPDERTQAAYHRTIRSVFGAMPSATEQASGGFVHVNAGRYAADEQVTERYYLSPKLNGRPGEAVGIWTQTLAEQGADQTVYYKVATHLARRYDAVIVYAASETADETREAVQAFIETCPAELLSDTNLPSAVPVAKGVSRAPEPSELNTLLRYRGKDAVSYNELAVALTELSLRRASHDFIKQSMTPGQVTPRMLAENSRIYFGQFIKLAGLDPARLSAT